jgi:hypothetical protein
MAFLRSRGQLIVVDDRRANYVFANGRYEAITVHSSQSAQKLHAKKLDVNFNFFKRSLRIKWAGKV